MLLKTLTLKVPHMIGSSLRTIWNFIAFFSNQIRLGNSCKWSAGRWFIWNIKLYFSQIKNYCKICYLLQSWLVLFQKNYFRNTYQGFKRFRSRWEPAFCGSWSESKLFAKVIGRLQKFVASKDGVSLVCFLCKQFGSRSGQYFLDKNVGHDNIPERGF